MYINMLELRLVSVTLVWRSWNCIPNKTNAHSATPLLSCLSNTSLL